MASEEEGKMRVFFIPFFASGHIIPVADLACLFAAYRQVEPTLVLTHANAALVRPTLRRSAAAGHQVKLLLYPFPDVGLPPGIENLSSAPSSESWRIERAVDLARDTQQELLRRHQPDVVVADIHFWWTTDVAAELGIPRITFHPIGVFPNLAMTILFKVRSQVHNGSDERPVMVPNFPGPLIEIPRSELPAFVQGEDFFGDRWERTKVAQLACYGVIVNTFYELEPEYCDLYRQVDARRAWFVGPLAQARHGAGIDNSAWVERGGDAVVRNKKQCLRWLECQERGSVVFVCFGSWCHFTKAQLREMAAGLETSGRPFLWVVRGSEDDEEAREEHWIPEGWKERVAWRGMVVTGWAPQVAILSHPAVGAFLSHCGWNSVLEAAAAGVPLLTWPLVFEQFINERLVVEVLGVGRRVWDGFRSTDDEKKVLVPAGAVARAVSGVMEEGEEARRRSRELASMSMAAVAENGSARRDLNSLMEELVATWRERHQDKHELV